ncbi:MAG TPA: S-layer homology domain-containing protein [Bacillota bacterium]|nr:S-layer homology domain-containing protein [Bacillota bacterium]
MKTRRMVSIVVAVVFSLVMVGTAYASFTDIDNNKHKDAIEQMSELGILNGYPDGSFRPDGLLNRAAAAKVAGFLLGYTEEDAQAAAEWESMFDDVYKGMGDHEWAMGWINLVANDGVINGYPNGEYGPGDELQMVQWVAILIRTLRHEEDGMSWPDDYNLKAESLGLSANLSYSGSSVVNRAQMARMTNTAIYDVEMPDSRKLIDIVEFDTEDEPAGEEGQNGDEQHEEVYENVNLSISASKALLSAGGGQTTQITAYVTHNDLPAEGAPVGFFAHVVSSDDDRSQQLSTYNTVTDADGKATVTYTTLAADDNEQIFIMANTRDDSSSHEWTETGTHILASNAASLIEGQITNPFTGEPYLNADIDFFNTENNNYSMFENASDENGYYSIAVQPGEYHIRFYLDKEGGNYYSGTYEGSHHNFSSDKFNIRIEMEVGQNKTYTLDTEMGIMKGVVNNLGSHRNLYFTRQGERYSTVIAEANEDGSFIIPLREGIYGVDAEGGHILNSNVKVEKGKVTDIGTFSR